MLTRIRAHVCTQVPVVLVFLAILVPWPLGGVPCDAAAGPGNLSCAKPRARQAAASAHYVRMHAYSTTVPWLRPGAFVRYAFVLWHLPARRASAASRQRWIRAKRATFLALRPTGTSHPPTRASISPPSFTLAPSRHAGSFALRRRGLRVPGGRPCTRSPAPPSRSLARGRAAAAEAEPAGRRACASARTRIPKWRTYVLTYVLRKPRSSDTW
mmetsp:Transcript_6378/g.17760  ORF Transcript_6378/g.17760 Transcript_6378/m.17760 type:complete len:213 (+) Transcript_6378:1327-1965(+)